MRRFVRRQRSLRQPGFCDYAAQKVIEVMGDAGAQDTKTLKLLPGKLFFLRTFDVADVYNRSYVAGQRAPSLVARNAGVRNRAVLFVRPAQPILDVALLWGAGVKCRSVAGQASL